MKELTITAPLDKLSDVRIALTYAIDHAEDPEARQALITTYVSYCNMLLDAVEVDAEE